jgi:hypothetical protein
MSILSLIERSNFLRIILPFGVGLVFLGAAVPKVLHPYRFFELVAEYNILSLQRTALVSAAVPWTEFILGVLLLTRTLTNAALLTSTMLLVCFMLAQVSVLVRGLTVSCGCFSTQASSSDLVGAGSLVRTCALFVVSMVALYLNLRETSSRRSP